MKGDFAKLNTLYEKIEAEPGMIAKSNLINKFIESYTGDIKLVLKLLLPGADLRVYNMGDKSVLKVLAGILGERPEEMSKALDQSGDLAGTVAKFFVKSTFPSPSAPVLSLEDVDNWLEKLNGLTTESAQGDAFEPFMKKCTSNELKWCVRLLDHDLKVGAGSKIVLSGLHVDAYDAFKHSNSIPAVVDRYLAGDFDKKGGSKGKKASTITLFTPIKPMLARPSKSFEDVMKRCPKGLACEIKYDGERIQIHKDGNSFQYFSRNLKPITPNKVADVKDSITQATSATSIVLDGEVLLIDKTTQQPLPFGTLGVHKQKGFGNACICVFVFDIMYLNGESVMGLPFPERRRLLAENVKEVPNRVKLSELYEVKAGEQQKIEDLMNRCLREGLEGLVFKGFESVYEPGARHWLKMKKDYLEGMADSVDLVVLGAYYGSGSKGGMLSVFLMGVFDQQSGTWKTVCKCGNGHDDATLDRLQTELKVTKVSNKRVPTWLNVSSSLTPDVVVADPDQAPVWEIEGAEFTESNSHTADGISIRFPRVTKIRTDKDPQSATDLDCLKGIVASSKARAATLGGGSSAAPGSPDSGSPGPSSAKAEKKKAPAKAKTIAAKDPRQGTLAGFGFGQAARKKKASPQKRKRDDEEEEDDGEDSDDSDDFVVPDDNDDEEEEDDDASEVMPAKKRRGDPAPDPNIPFNQILAGVTIAISGLQNPDRGIVRDRALALGARYEGDWTATTTHLVAVYSNTPKCNVAKAAGGTIVGQQWVTDCYNEKRRLPEKRYLLI